MTTTQLTLRPSSSPPAIDDIPLDKIDVPPEYEREVSPQQDEALTNSIRKHGVQIRVHLIPDGDRYTLVDGTKRLAISYVCRYSTVPAILEPPAPKGVDPVRYRNRLRFHLHWRQDLTPSQRADFIVKTMAQYDMTQAQVAHYNGLNPGSVTNWLAIRNYIPEIVQAIDNDVITLFHGRSFDGMTPEGQKTVWKALRKDLPEMSGHQAHKLVRERYSPRRYPQFYLSAEKTIEKLARKAKGRKSSKRTRLSKTEMDLLANDLDLKEVELADTEKENRGRLQLCIMAGPIAAGILRNEEIAAHIELTRLAHDDIELPKNWLELLGVFSEAY